MCVCTLTTEPFHLWTRNLTCRSAGTISKSSLMGKVKGQGHEVKKCDFHAFGLGLRTMYVGVSVSTMAKGLCMRGTREVSQRSGFFIYASTDFLSTRIYSGRYGTYTVTTYLNFC